MKKRAPFTDRLDIVRNLGPLHTIHFAAQRLRNRLVPPDLLMLRSRYARYPTYCRRGTSDLDVWGQIFTHREYRCLDHVQDAKLIIDCGANVGFSSAYFLTRHPRAIVIAVEPDGGNFDALARNVAPYGSRARCVKAGIWWRPAELTVIDSPFAGDAREWARGVREVEAGEQGDVIATDIDTLLHESGQDRISILKVDIEGTEEALFAAPCPWLEKVDNLVIETHGPLCERNVREAAVAAGLRMTRFNEELMVGVR